MQKISPGLFHDAYKDSAPAELMSRFGCRLELKFHSSFVRNVIVLPLDRTIRRAFINTPRRIRQVLRVEIDDDSVACDIAHGQIESETIIEVLVETRGCTNRGQVTVRVLSSQGDEETIFLIERSEVVEIRRSERQFGMVGCPGPAFRVNIGIIGGKCQATQRTRQKPQVFLESELDTTGIASSTIEEGAFIEDLPVDYGPNRSRKDVVVEFFIEETEREVGVLRRSVFERKDKVVRGGGLQIRLPGSDGQLASISHVGCRYLTECRRPNGSGIR